MSNIVKRGKTYWFRATINGREIRQSLRTSSIAVARKEALKLLEEYKNQIHRGIHKTPWTEAVIAWTPYIRNKVGEKTAERYAVSLSQCERWLKPLLIQQIDGRVIADLIDARTKVATHATVKRDLTAISSVLEYCIGREWIETNPINTKRRLLVERRDPIALPEQEAIDAVVAVSSKRFGDYILAALLTGCRQDELATAKWSGFNSKAKTLEVIGKGKKRRTITLYDEACQLIASQMRVLGSDLIFCRDDGYQWHDPATTFSHMRRIAIAKAEKEGRRVKRFRYHDLRHLFAVEALRSGRMGIYELQKHLGHTTIRVTEMYLEFLTPEQQLAAEGKASAHYTAQQNISYNSANDLG